MTDPITPEPTPTVEPAPSIGIQYCTTLKFEVWLQEQEDTSKPGLASEFVLRNLNQKELMVVNDQLVEKYNGFLADLRVATEKDGLFLDQDIVDGKVSTQYVVKITFYVLQQAHEGKYLPGLQQKLTLRNLNVQELLTVDTMAQDFFTKFLTSMREISETEGLYLDLD